MIIEYINEDNRNLEWYWTQYLLRNAIWTCSFSMIDRAYDFHHLIDRCRVIKNDCLLGFPIKSPNDLLVGRSLDLILPAICVKKLLRDSVITFWSDIRCPSMSRESLLILFLDFKEIISLIPFQICLEFFMLSLKSFL